MSTSVIFFVSCKSKMSEDFHHGRVGSLPTNDTSHTCHIILEHFMTSFLKRFRAMHPHRLKPRCVVEETLGQSPKNVPAQTPDKPRGEEGKPPRRGLKNGRSELYHHPPVCVHTPPNHRCDTFEPLAAKKKESAKLHTRKNIGDLSIRATA